LSTPSLRLWLVVVVVLAAGSTATGCGEGVLGTGAADVLSGDVTPDGSTPGLLAVRPSDSSVSTVNLADYTVSTHLGAAGGSLALPDGTTLTLPAGAMGEDVGLGLRPAASAPAAETAGTIVSAWIDGGLSLSSIVVPVEAPIVLELPATPPVEALGHPGLQLWMVLPDGVQVPVDGTYDDSSGRFRAELLALPSEFTLAVVFDPAIVRLDGADEPEGADEARRTFPLDGAGWPTVEWVLDFDGNRVTLAQARKVLAAARKAARAYSDAGFKEPFLYRDESVLGERWHLHLVSGKGSSFDGNTKPASADVAEHFGRQYLNVARIDAPLADALGGVVASVAHELFHAVFASYRVPGNCFNFVSGGTTYCYKSYAGYNEGMATAVGYFLDQGSPKPRPSEPPCPLHLPLGSFDAGARSLAYRNQDFFVFLLRAGSLANVRSLLASLATAVVEPGMTNVDLLGAYAQAIEGGGVGTDVPFAELVGGYVANRGYFREPEGHIWPDEPHGGAPGAAYVLDATLFHAATATLDDDDCTVDPDRVDCEVTMPNVAPLAGALVRVDVASLAEDWAFVPTTLAVSAGSDAPTVPFWAFGEQGGVGSREQTVESADGAEVGMAGVDTTSPQVNVLLTQGTAAGNVTVNLAFTPESNELRYTGMGTMVDTNNDEYGPATCTQDLPMVLTLKRGLGWVELNFTKRVVYFGLVDGVRNCTLLDQTEDLSFWSDSFTSTSFSLGDSSLYPAWIDGTYSPTGAYGDGSTTYLDITKRVTFSLTREP